MNNNTITNFFGDSNFKVIKMTKTCTLVSRVECFGNNHYFAFDEKGNLYDDSYNVEAIKAL